MNKKILGKITSIFGYKLIDKNLIKNKRLLSKKTLNLDYFLNHFFSSNSIRDIIQVGANDGIRFDPLTKYIKEYETRTIFVEPILKYFKILKSNYSHKPNFHFENSAISKNNGYINIYKVSEKNLKLYDDHVSGVSSIDKNHLLKHGIKRGHIEIVKINSMRIVDLINKYEFKNLDLLFLDVEGAEGEIIVNFFETSNLRPIMIFEFIHVQSDRFEECINLLNKNNYIYFDIDENMICIPIEKKKLIKLSNF